MLPFFDMPMDWKRFILILAGGVSLGFAWNAFSGRGIVLGQSVLVQAGDELVKAPDAKALLDKGALFLDARPRDFCQASHIVARKLREKGFAAAILDEGLPAWQDAQLPLDTEPRS